MGRKGVTALVYEHMIENIGKYWKTFENCIETIEYRIKTNKKHIEIYKKLYRNIQQYSKILEG